MTSQAAGAAVRPAIATGIGQRVRHLAADSHIELSASSAPVAIHERHRAVLARAHAIDLEVKPMTTLSALSASTRLDAGGTPGGCAR